MVVTFRQQFKTVKTACVAIALLAGLTACRTVALQHTPLPEDLLESAQVSGFESARSWADAFSPAYYETLRQRERQARRSGVSRRDSYILVLSGGGQDGAFGAGYLNGWTARGNRPEFEVVTGVSTGALIAPLAFLGPGYDVDLKRFYTSYSTRDIIRPRLVSGLLGGPAVTDSQPLADLIAEFVTPEFLGEIAEQHRRGRRLAIITTNIEAQRPVIWDMGQIAEAGTPEALTLFRSVMLASASIPGVFPPVKIDVQANGATYSELHVDGATSTNIFLAPLSFSKPEAGSTRRGRFYILTNGKYLPDYEPIEPRTLQVASRAISTMVTYITKADVQRLQLFANRTGAELRFVAIPNEFDVESNEPFDKAYMNALFDFGYAAGLKGNLETSRPRVF